MNKGVKIVLVLSLISSGMALALAGVNSFTAPTIAKNTAQRQQEAKEKIFEGCEFTTIDLKNTDSQYLKSADKATKNNEFQGFVYNCEGKNAYGGVAIMLGVKVVDNKAKMEKFVVTSNTESYAGTLEDNYITPVQSGTRDYTDVSCGATYGATLIKNMINAGLDDANKQLGGN